MRYLIGFIVTIGLIILIIVLLLTGSGKKSIVPKTLHLTDYTYSDSAEAIYLVDGPIQSDQDHNTIKISVSKSQVTAVLYQGYSQNPLRTLSYPNNSDAFAVFILALNHAGFSRGDPSKSLQDERGYCPSGQRTIYQFMDGTNSLMRYWTTTCGQGTFKGALSTVRYLFREQIPQKDRQPFLQGSKATL